MEAPAPGRIESGLVCAARAVGDVPDDACGFRSGQLDAGRASQRAHPTDFGRKPDESGKIGDAVVLRCRRSFLRRLGLPTRLHEGQVGLSDIADERHWDRRPDGAAAHARDRRDLRFLWRRRRSGRPQRLGVLPSRRHALRHPYVSTWDDPADTPTRPAEMSALYRTAARRPPVPSHSPSASIVHHYFQYATE
jgi:hypothetical protein